MNGANSAASPVIDEAQIYDGEVMDLEVKRQPAAIARRTELTPETLRAEIDRQTEMRAIMTGYVKSQMVEGHHYYSFNKLGKQSTTNSNLKADKPALTQ